MNWGMQPNQYEKLIHINLTVHIANHYLQITNPIQMLVFISRIYITIDT